MVLHENNAEILRTACTIMASALQHDKEVQKIAKKCQTFNIMQRFANEDKVKNRESLMGLLSAFLRGENFEAKREFLSDYNGLQFLLLILLDKENSSVRL